MESIPTKDIAIAALGGSAAIAAVLLVFMGFMFVKAEALPSTADNQFIARYSRLAKIGLIPLMSQAIVIGCAYLWLFYPQNSFYFYGWSAGFLVALALFVVYSVVATLML